MSKADKTVTQMTKAGTYIRCLGPRCENHGLIRRLLYDIDEMNKVIAKLRSKTSESTGVSE